MFHKSLILCLFFVLPSGALWGQAGDRVAYPAHSITPLIIPNALVVDTACDLVGCARQVTDSPRRVQ